MLNIWIGSSPCESEEITKGVARLKAAGVKFQLAAETKKKATSKESNELPFIAGSDEFKFKTLTKLLSQNRVRNIMAIRGGYGGLRLLPWLDKWQPKSPRSLREKQIWGFSDQTTVQNYLYFRFGMPWVHSPMLTSNSFHDPQGLEADFWEELLPFFNRNRPTLIRYDLFCDLENPKFLPAKTIQAPMIGGNLASFNVLLSHPLSYKFCKSLKSKQSFVFFIEDVNEPPYKVDRLLQQLSQHPLFDHVAVLAAGHFTDSKTVLPVIQRFARDHKKTLLHGLPAGHDRPNLPLPMGRDVRINFAPNRQALVSFDFVI